MYYRSLFYPGRLPSKCCYTCS